MKDSSEPQGKDVLQELLNQGIASNITKILYTARSEKQIHEIFKELIVHEKELENSNPFSKYCINGYYGKSLTSEESNEKLKEIFKFHDERRAKVLCLVKTREMKNQLLENQSLKIRENGIVGNSEKITKLRSEIAELTLTNSIILILGETGTGKSRLARIIHNCSNKNGSFIKVTCTELPDNEDRASCELFGNIRGAYDGLNENDGYILQANNGTLFLDEIGLLSEKLQRKLLSVLQDKEITRVGETTPRIVNFRLIVATNENLEERVLNGSFRKDFYYRIKQEIITMPSLNERVEDIVDIIEVLLNDMNTNNEDLNTRFINFNGVTNEVIDHIKSLILKNQLSGNLRQLYSDLLSVSKKNNPSGFMSTKITLEQWLNQNIDNTQSLDPIALIDTFSENFETAKAQFDQLFFKHHLNMCHGNKTDLAEKISLSYQHTLKHIKKL